MTVVTLMRYCLAKVQRNESKVGIMPSTYGRGSEMYFTLSMNLDNVVFRDENEPEAEYREDYEVARILRELAETLEEASLIPGVALRVMAASGAACRKQAGSGTCQPGTTTGTTGSNRRPIRAADQTKCRAAALPWRRARMARPATIKSTIPLAAASARNSIPSAG